MSVREEHHTDRLTVPRSYAFRARESALLLQLPPKTSETERQIGLTRNGPATLPTQTPGRSRPGTLHYSRYRQPVSTPLNAQRYPRTECYQPRVVKARQRPYPCGHTIFGRMASQKLHPRAQRFDQPTRNGARRKHSTFPIGPPSLCCPRAANMGYRSEGILLPHFVFGALGASQLSGHNTARIMFQHSPGYQHSTCDCEQTRCVFGTVIE